MLGTKTKVFFVFVVCALSVVILLEAILRKYDLDTLRGLVRNKTGESLSDCLTSDPELDHKLIPSCEGIVKTRDFEVSLKTNSLGFRDEELGPKVEGKKRILIVGDSFAEGWGVSLEDRFDYPKHEEDLVGYEFINFGTRSYSPILEAILLSKYIDQVKPDMVISLFDFSDLHDDFYYGGWEKHDEVKKLLGLEAFNTGVEIWPNESWKTPTGWVAKSALFSSIKQRLQLKKLNSEKRISLLNLTYDISLFGKGAEYENYDLAWNLNRANLIVTEEYLKRKNIPFVVAVVPRGIYVGEDEWDKGRNLIGLKKGVIYSAPKIFEISDIDLLGTFKELEKTNPGLLYYPFDGHWTPMGHMVAQQELFHFLEAFKWATLENNK